MKTLPKYDKWIADYRKSLAKNCAMCRVGHDCDQIHTAGFCHSAALSMQRIFPELTLVRGYVDTKIMHPESLMERPENATGMAHWWLVMKDGTVVDPTADQFQRYGGIVSYDPYNEKKHGKLPIGKCMNCGDFVWKDKYGDRCCSKECEEALMSDFV